MVSGSHTSIIVSDLKSAMRREFFPIFSKSNILFIEKTQMPNAYKCQHLFCSPWCSIYPLEANCLLLRGLPNCEKRWRNLWNYIHETKCKKRGRSASLVLIVAIMQDVPYSRVNRVSLVKNLNSCLVTGSLFTASLKLNANNDVNAVLMLHC